MSRSCAIEGGASIGGGFDRCARTDLAVDPLAVRGDRRQRRLVDVVQDDGGVCESRRRDDVGGELRPPLPTAAAHDHDPHAKP
jgi:hypothetical protein